MSELIVVAGGGGFIGGHLCKILLEDGYRVRAADLRPFDEWEQLHNDVENVILDLSILDDCQQAVESADIVYQLAADMGGMGFIENNRCLCMLSVLINTHMIMASHKADVKQYFYSSSACAYSIHKQTFDEVIALKESDAYPAMPEDGYGWEKLFSERMCRHFREDFGLKTRVARYHNVYGGMGTWRGGREKAPAAICRKVAIAKQTGDLEIEIWGDGEQQRSFQYIDDCVEGTIRIMNSNILEPINLGSSELVTINELVNMVESIAGVKLNRKYKLDAPKGVRGRNSDNTLIKKYLNWEPNTPLLDGLTKTYEWIYNQVKTVGPDAARE